ncbi:MAG: hypothetical protein GY850_43785 [bacterium]|nr:hypothetical protein [bacterium]
MTEPRKRSWIIAEAVRQKIEQKEKEEMEKLLIVRFAPRIKAGWLN